MLQCTIAIWFWHRTVSPVVFSYSSSHMCCYSAAGSQCRRLGVAQCVVSSKQSPCPVCFSLSFRSETHPNKQNTCVPDHTGKWFEWLTVSVCGCIHLKMPFKVSAVSDCCGQCAHSCRGSLNKKQQLNKNSAPDIHHVIVLLFLLVSVA